MKKPIVVKGLVLGVIILFLGLVLVPIINSSSNSNGADLEFRRLRIEYRRTDWSGYWTIVADYVNNGPNTAEGYSFDAEVKGIFTDRTVVFRAFSTSGDWQAEEKKALEFKGSPYLPGIFLVHSHLSSIDEIDESNNHDVGIYLIIPKQGCIKLLDLT